MVLPFPYAPLDSQPWRGAAAPGLKTKRREKNKAARRHKQRLRRR